MKINGISKDRERILAGVIAHLHSISTACAFADSFVSGEIRFSKNIVDKKLAWDVMMPVPEGLTAALLPSSLVPRA